VDPNMKFLGVSVFLAWLAVAQGAFKLGTPLKNNPEPTHVQTVVTTDPNKPPTTRKFPFHSALDASYDLHWDFNATHITFEAVVKTVGWVGLGVSPNGGMDHSDVVIGWFKDGQPHFSDRHADGKYMPAQDNHQDWFLMGMLETNGYTRLTMVRALETCDPQDLAIKEGTTRIIYAYNHGDPTGDGSINYHGGNTRGSKSLILLDPPSTDKKPSTLPDDVITYDILNFNYSVPATDTTYRCTIWKMPGIGGKHHMIRFSPVITPGHEKLVHHMILYWCSEDLPANMVGSEHMCYKNDPDSVSSCQHVFFAWAIGGQSFDYPLVAGQSLGAAGDPGYFKLETHYDNPGYRHDFVDNSGLRMYLTQQLRQHDAGFIEVGVAVDSYQIIPPGNPGFMSSGYCREECIEQTLGANEIHVFSSMLHSHLLGSKMRTRHFRNGTELEHIAQDNNYDFNFQEQRYLPQERTIKAGDSLTVECVYDSTGRTGMTYGGLSSRQEMCLSFLVYYPKTPLAQCRSRLVYKELQDHKPSELAYWMEHIVDWSNQTSQAVFQAMVDNAWILNECSAPHHNITFNYQYTDQPTVAQPLNKTEACHN